MSRFLAALIATPLLACSLPDSLHLEDDLGDDAAADIHSPYVRGTTVTFRAGGWGEGKVDDTWDVVPDDDSVLVRIEAGDDDDDDDEETDEGLAVEFRAVSEGTTAVSLVNEDGEVEARTTIEVVMPDVVTVHVATAERTGLPEFAAEGCDVTIIEGGTGGLIAQYWLEDSEVFGNEVLSLLSDDPVVLDVDHSYSGKDLDWLQLTPEATGTHTVDLLVDGLHLETLSYEAVAYDDVASTALLGADETNASEEDWLELLVQTFDADDCPIYGAQWTWHVDGELQEDRGDMFRYQFDESVVTELEVQFGDHERTAMVHGVGTVANSNAASCSAVAGTAALAPALLGLLVLARRRED